MVGVSYNSTREELYQESTSYHLDLIEDMQKSISTHLNRIAELESRNVYLTAQLVEQTDFIARQNSIIESYSERVKHGCDCNWQY